MPPTETSTSLPAASSWLPVAQLRTYIRTTLFNRDGFKRYLTNSGWHFIARVATLLVSFFTTIYVIRYLGPEHYGTLSYAVSFVSLFAFIASLGIDQIVFRDLVRTPEHEGVILGTSLVLKVIGGTVACLGAIGVSWLIDATYLERILICILAFTQFAGAGTLATYSFQAKVESKYPALISIASSFILACAKLLVIYFDKGIIYFSAILLLETILLTMFHFVVYQRRYHLLQNWRFDYTIARTLILSSLPLLLSTVSILIYSRIDQVMLRHFIDSTAVGLYDAAVRLSDVWYIIPNIILGALFPAIINAQKVSGRLFVTRLWWCAGLLTGLTLVVIAPTIFLAPFIITTLFGSAYTAAAPVLSIYIWSLLGFSLGQLMNTYLIAENQTHIYLFTSVITVIVNIAFNYVLIPPLGISGAALATLISYSLIPLIPFAFTPVRTKLLTRSMM